MYRNKDSARASRTISPARLPSGDEKSGLQQQHQQHIQHLRLRRPGLFCAFFLKAEGNVENAKPGRSMQCISSTSLKCKYPMCWTSEPNDVNEELPDPWTNIITFLFEDFEDCGLRHTMTCNFRPSLNFTYSNLTFFFAGVLFIVYWK